MQIYYNTPISIKRNNLKQKKTKTKTEKRNESIRKLELLETESTYMV